MLVMSLIQRSGPCWLCIDYCRILCDLGATNDCMQLVYVATHYLKHISVQTVGLYYGHLHLAMKSC